MCDFRNMPNIFSVDQFLGFKMKKKKRSVLNIIVLGTREANNCIRLSTVPEQNSLAHTHLWVCSVELYVIICLCALNKWFEIILYSVYFISQNSNIFVYCLTGNLTVI